MKRKYIAVFLLILGAVIFCLSIILSVISTVDKNIIGGADFTTFLFVFCYEKKGVYSTLAFFGVVSIIASAIVGIVKRQK